MTVYRAWTSAPDIYNAPLNTTKWSVVMIAKEIRMEELTELVDLIDGEIFKKNGDKLSTKMCHGYVTVKIKGIRYREHRIVYQMHHGYELKQTDIIDHINHDTTDNSIDNLRLCDHKQNAMNRLRRKDNKSGHKNIYKKTDKRGQALWCVQIRTAYKRFQQHFPLTDAGLIEAIRVRDAKTQEMHGSFTCLG